MASIIHPCLKALEDNRFAFSGRIMNMVTGEFTPTTIIYQLTTGKDGRMFRGRRDSWMALLFCPVCGEEIHGN